MKRGGGTARRLALLLAVVLLHPFAAGAAPRKESALESQLRGHVEELASDEYTGREPGTDGEIKTLRYLGRKWFEIGLVSGTNNPGSEWFAPVTLVAREPATSRTHFIRRGRRIVVPDSEVLVLTSGQRSLVRNAPVLFIGKGEGQLPGRNDLAGRAVLLLDGDGSNSERQNALLEGGASAVLTVLDGDRSLDNVSARRRRSGYALANDAIGGDLEGFITEKGLGRLLASSGTTIESLQEEARKPGFEPRMLDFTASLEATTHETTIHTHNMIGKISGRRPDSGAVLFVAHWDAFGICGEAPAEDVICNGAIDNASGVAVLTEIARRLARAPQPDRDIYFLATTAEEIGLLGAHAFAENPPLPLNQIVAAFNIDSFALAPAGLPLAIVGKGMTPLDGTIARVAKQQRRKIVPGDAANDYVRRQDGWALLQHDVPTVMVSSSYSDVARVERFFDGDYHRPSDGVDRPIDLGGAAEDVLFHVALGRYFADARKVPSPVK